MSSNIIINARGRILGRDDGFVSFGLAHKYTATVTYLETVSLSALVIRSFTRYIQQVYPYMDPDTPIFIFNGIVIAKEFIDEIDSIEVWLCKFQVIWNPYCIEMAEGAYTGRD